MSKTHSEITRHSLKLLTRPLGIKIPPENTILGMKISYPTRALMLEESLSIYVYFMAFSFLFSYKLCHCYREG
jgi:hypothetical protein